MDPCGICMLKGQILCIQSLIRDICHTNKIAILQNPLQSAPGYSNNFTDLGNGWVHPSHFILAYKFANKDDQHYCHQM